MIKNVTPQRIVQRHLNEYSNGTENNIFLHRRSLGQVINEVYLMLIVLFNLLISLDLLLSFIYPFFRMLYGKI